MKVVVAIDSFKGSMTSMQAGNACKEGQQPLGTGNLQQIIWMLS